MPLVLRTKPPQNPPKTTAKTPWRPFHPSGDPLDPPLAALSTAQPAATSTHLHYLLSGACGVA